MSSMHAAIHALEKLAQVSQVPDQTPPQTADQNPHLPGGNPETLPPKSASWSHHPSILGGDAVLNGLYEGFEPGDLCCKPDTIKAEMPEVFEFNRLTTKEASAAFWRRVLPQPTDQQRHQAQAVCGSVLTHKTAAVAPHQYQQPLPVPGQPVPQPAIPGQTPGAGVPQPGAAVPQPPPVPGSPSNPVAAGGGLPQAPQAPGLGTAGATPTGGASPVAPGHPTMTGVAQRPIGLDRPQDTRAAALPGVPGHAATNVIDQQGGLDPRGLTVDGNNAAGIKKLAEALSMCSRCGSMISVGGLCMGCGMRKLAAACGVSTDNTQTAQVSKARILQALGMPSDFAVNKNQKQAGLVDATVSGLGAGLGSGAGYAFNAGPLGGALGGAAGGGIAGAGLGAGAGLLSAALSDRDEEGNKPWLRRAIQGAGVGGVAGAGLGGTVGAGIGALGKLVRTMAPGAKWVPPSQRTPEVEQLPTLPTEYDDARLNEYFRQLKEKKKPGAATPNAPIDRTTGRMSPAVNGFIQNLLQGSGQKQAGAVNVVGQPQFATTQLLRLLTAASTHRKQAAAMGDPGAVTTAVGNTAGRVGNALMIAPWLAAHSTFKNPDQKSHEETLNTMSQARPDALSDTELRLGGPNLWQDMVWKAERDGEDLPWYEQIGGRALQNPRTGPLGKVIGWTSAPAVALGASLSRQPHYNPFTDVAHNPTDNKALTEHQLGHAIDYNTSGGDGKVPDSTLGRLWRGTKRDLYSLASTLPLAGNYHEFKANSESEKALMDALPKDQFMERARDRNTTLPANAYGGLAGDVGTIAGAAIGAPFLGSIQQMTTTRMMHNLYKDPKFKAVVEQAQAKRYDMRNANKAPKDGDNDGKVNDGTKNEKQAMTPAEFGAKVGIRGGLLSSLIGSGHATGVPGGRFGDEYDEEAARFQEEAGNRLDSKPWYNPQKLNHRFLAPVMDFAGPIAAVGAGVGTGLGTGNPLAGLAVGGLTGALAGTPRRWATSDLNNWAEQDINASEHTPENKKELINRFGGSNLKALIAQALPGVVAGGAAGFGQMVENGSPSSASRDDWQQFREHGREYNDERPLPTIDEFNQQLREKLERMRPPREDYFRQNQQFGTPYPPGSAGSQPAGRGLGQSLKDLLVG